jgi:small-conductance mechanosensitive channel
MRLLGARSPVTPRSLFLGLAVLYATWVVSRAGRDFIERVALPRTPAEPGFVNAVGTLAGIGMMVAGVLLAFQAVGFNVTGLTILGGALGVGVGLGLRDVTNNFVSGLVVLFEGTVKPGGVIELGNGALGRVVRVGLRSTTVHTPDNNDLMVPNSDLVTKPVINRSLERLTRVRVAVGVSCDTRPSEVLEALTEAARDVTPAMASTRPVVLFRDFVDNAMVFEVSAWADEAMDAPRVASQLRLNVWNELDQRRIQMPCPQVDWRAAEKQRAERSSAKGVAGATGPGT